MPRFEPAPEDDHVGRDFGEFPELAAALEDLALPKPLGPDPTDVPEAEPTGGGRLTPDEVEARLGLDDETPDEVGD